MATYTVKAPDGKTITLQGPDGASHADVIAQAQKLYKPTAAPAPAASSTVEDYRARWSNLSPVQARQLLKRYGDGVSVSDPRSQALAQIAGVNLVAKAPPTKAQRITAGAKAASAADSNQGFFNSVKAGMIRGAFGIPERLAAAGERFLPSAVTGNTTDASYDDILSAIRARTDADLSQSATGNAIGQLFSGGIAGGAAAGAIRSVAGRAAGAASPAVARAGNVLEGLTTLRKGQTAANAGKVVLGGATAGAAQSAGEGNNPVKGAAAGAAGAAVLGGGFKVAQVLSRPLRDVLRTTSADRILNRLTNATRDQLEAEANRVRQDSGVEPTLFEILPLADRNRILSHTVQGRDSVVERATGAIRRRAANIGVEMSSRIQSILQPARTRIEQNLREDLARARGGVADPADEDMVRRAMTNSTDMEALRNTEQRLIMAPHDNTRTVDSFADLLPNAPHPTDPNTRIDIDPEVSSAIRTAAGTLARRPENAGITVGEVSGLISKLRKRLGGDDRNQADVAENAIQHLQQVLDETAPEAGAAAERATAAYAARSRMMEGMDAGMETKLRNAVRTKTSGKAARLVRNAYDSTEGGTGRNLGQGNVLLDSLGGSPEQALASTVRMGRGGIGREVNQNIGVEEGDAISRAAQTQADAANVLASASRKIQEEGGAGAAAPEAIAAAITGLHPGSFAGAKINAVKKLVQVSGIPNSRANTIVDMVFSQDPAMMRRALNAVGNTKNGSEFLRYLGRTTGQLASEATGGSTPAEPAAETYVPPADPVPGEDVAPNDGGAEDAPVDPATSPYAANLQVIYDNESPEMLDLIDRVSGQESGGNQFDANGQPITSSAGAIGVMQVMPATAPEAARLAGVPFDENAYRNDPVYNKLIGIAYLSELLRRYDGDVAKATAAYNAGAGRVDDALAKGDNWLAHLPAETQNYVQKVA